MTRVPSRARWFAAALLLWSQVGVPMMPALRLGAAAAWAQADKPPVQRGQEYYEQSKFDDAISLLRDLVDRGQIKGDDLQKARELLARSYVKKGYPVQAKEMFKALLRDNAAYRPDPIRVPPDETAVFEQALKEYDSDKTAPPPQPSGAPPAQPPAGTTPQPGMAPSRAIVPATEPGKKPLTKQWWFWALGAGVVVGGIAAAAGGGGGDDKPAETILPGFPGPPN